VRRLRLAMTVTKSRSDGRVLKCRSFPAGNGMVEMWMLLGTTWRRRGRGPAGVATGEQSGQVVLDLCR
jgi:hypothetical protein